MHIFFFAILLALLLAVEVAGSTGMGAQRWINLGVIKLQPSELMKIGLILALARYFHGVSMENVRRIPYLLIPLLLVALPSILVLKQPDLGTALFSFDRCDSFFYRWGSDLEVCVGPRSNWGRDTHRLEHAAYLSAKAHSNLLQP